MSEYQYYEFLAVDRPLGERERRTLRRLSTRATITPTSFVNTYNYGDFRGDPSLLMAKYFDVFVYVANWGTRQLMFRLPRRGVDIKAFSSYCAGRSATFKTRGRYLLIEFLSEGEDDGWVSGEGWMGSLVPLRADLLRGDLRCLYLDWLIASQCGELDDAVVDPPVPPGPGKLTASLSAFADFFGLDKKAVKAAATRRPGAPNKRPSGKRTGGP
jgi:hypothetical protein